jgi:AcrR family transcriptional regulator
MFIYKEEWMAGATGSMGPKAERTRARILDSALRLFAERGYEATTMRDVAREAGASVGLAYRYFASKDEFALALFEELAEGSVVWAREEMPTGGVAERFEAAMLAKVDQVEPHRDPLAALLSRSVDPVSRISVLGEHTAGIRASTSRVFTEVVEGATDAPKGKQARELGAVLYGLHFAILLYWFYDRTEGARATRDVVRSARDVLRFVRPALRLPSMSRVLTRMSRALVDVGIGDVGGA